MTAEPAPQRGRRRAGKPASTRELLTRRRVGVLMLVAGALIVIGGAWLAVTGLLARTRLEAVRTDITRLRAELTSGDLTAARGTLKTLQGHADSAASLTSGPAWAVAAALPAGGQPFDSIRGIAGSVDSLAQHVLPALLDARTSLDPTTLRQPDGTIEVARISAVVPALDRANAAMTSVTGRVRRLPTGTWLSPVDRARGQLLTQLVDVSGTVRTADLAARILPPMLGVDGVRNYFVGFQNNAEARGTGGLPGAFGILHVDHGKPSFTRFENDGALDKVTAKVDLGTDYDQLYGPGNPYGLYVNSNLSPNFPYAAQIWTGMWQRKTGQQLDGAIAIDPGALSYLLAVTGPAVLPDKSTVDSGNVVALTESTAYTRFGNDVAGRKQFLLDVARGVSKHVVDFHGSASNLVDALQRSAQERRLQVWSRDPAVEALLTQTDASGTVPSGPEPYAGLSIVNDAGNKLDYYLDRTLRWQATGCGTTRTVTVTATLTNTAPLGLPSYVANRSDVHTYPVKTGDNRLDVSYFATQGALIDSVTVDGKATEVGSGRELGHPVVSIDLELPRGDTRTVVFRLTEPTGSGTPTILRQALVRPLTVEVDQPVCK